MDVRTYRANQALQSGLHPYRTPCRRCLQHPDWCYCASVRPFDPKITFAILIHHLENRRRIATGRMSHLALLRSHLILGHRYDDDTRVNGLLNDPTYDPFVLIPGKNSMPIDTMTQDERTKRFSNSKNLLIFVVDGTWGTASKTIFRSENLRNLPKICFTPTAPSKFRIRHQPRQECISTIEAIHQTLELLGPTQDFELTPRTHDHLLDLFDRFVERRIDRIRSIREETGTMHPRRKKSRHAKN